jgi:hypothetical protein
MPRKKKLFTVKVPDLQQHRQVCRAPKEYGQGGICGPEVEVLTLPAGTFLYRADPIATLDRMPPPRVCTDTGKIGVYFGTHPFYAVCMVTERDRTLTIARFVLTRPLVTCVGKYSYLAFRLRPTHDGIPYGTACADENVNHFDRGAYPLLRYMRGGPECPLTDAIRDQFPPDMGEVFVASRMARTSVKFLDSLPVSWTDAWDVLDHYELKPDAPYYDELSRRWEVGQTSVSREE